MAVLANLFCDQDGSMLTIGDIRQFGLAVLRVDTRPAKPSIRNYSKVFQLVNTCDALYSRVMEEITITGDLEPFWPFVLVGRETTFWPGWYEVDI